MTHDGDGMTHDGMTHDGDKMVYVYGMTHDVEVMTHEDDAAVEMFYNDNGISASDHNNNSNSTNRMGMVNKTLL